MFIMCAFLYNRVTNVECEAVGLDNLQQITPIRTCGRPD